MPIHRRDEQAAQDRHSAQGDDTGVRQSDNDRGKQYEGKIGGKLASRNGTMDGQASDGRKYYRHDQRGYGPRASQGWGQQPPEQAITVQENCFRRESDSMHLQAAAAQVNKASSTSAAQPKGPGTV